MHEKLTSICLLETDITSADLSKQKSQSVTEKEFKSGFVVCSI